MRIHLNQTISNKYIPIKYQGHSSLNKLSATNPQTENNAVTTLSPVNLAYYNITFGKNMDADFLLKQSKHLKCAYSGKLMLTKNEIKDIFQKLEKRPNVQSAINLLTAYEKYMHDTELAIFSIIKDSKHKNKLNLQNILQELQPDALKRLKEKQITIIKSTDSYIENLSPAIANLVRLIRDNALAKIEDNTFGRQPPLEMIKAVKAKGQDAKIIMKIYQTWYKLPNSARDVDAFIVKYSRKPHIDIARRLISPSMATIEHIVPTSRKKKNSNFLGNMILVSARFNNDRKSMPLDEYIALNREIDIPKHLQKYIDLVIREINRPGSDFSLCGMYPERIRKAIAKETSGKINLKTDSLTLTKTQKKAIDASKKLSQKYVTSFEYEK